MGINPTERNFALLLTLRERKTMSELVIKTAKENGDLPEDFDDGDNEMNWLKESFNPSLMDIFNPALLRKKFEKINGHTNKDNE